MKPFHKKFIFTAIAISCLCIAGCWIGDFYYSRSFINAFQLYDGIKVRRATINSTKWINIYGTTTKEVGLLSKGSDKDLFDDLCDLYGDNTYNREVAIPGDGYYTANHPPCAGLDVISNKDFDAEHPAGTSLADIMTIQYRSAVKFIENGYKDKKDYMEDIRKPLDELQPTDLTLSIRNIFLIFDKEPDVLETHGLTFFWTTTEGITYTTSFNYDFTLPEGEVEPYTVSIEYDTIYNYTPKH